ncbi:hypothetical protein KAU37_09315 [Candidatus Bipolaricaulota bacterium]|nr:hypothetical protein [Candidatus Bipolaricaulota bacterium]
MSRFNQGLAHAARAYREFVRKGRGINVWDDLQGGVLLGTERFAEKLKPLLMEQASTKEIPRKERLTARPSLAELFSGI